MPLDVLLDSITKEGDAEAQRVVDDARQTAARSRAAADARTSQRCGAAVAMTERELRASLDARRAEARADARARVLQARSRFLERVFGEVETNLSGYLERDPAGDALERMVQEARAYFADDRVRIRCRPGLVARLNEGNRDGMEVLPDEFAPEGVIVESLDRRVRIENTLLARLRRLRRALSVDLLSAMRTTP